MDPSTSEPHEHDIDQAFEAFRTSLQQTLEDAARRTVESELERLQQASATFVLEEVDFTLTIQNLRVASSPSGSPIRSTGAAPRSPRGKREGRGKVRPALLAAFAAHAELDTDELRAELASSGIETSEANMHQQLRRLVQSGELSRVGRGRYRLAAQKGA